jgi:hypothetical protein
MIEIPDYDILISVLISRFDLSGYNNRGRVRVKICNKILYCISGAWKYSEFKKNTFDFARFFFFFFHITAS